MAGVLEHGGAALAAQLGAAFGDHVADLAEPALPVRRPGGVLAFVPSDSAVDDTESGR